MTNTKEVGGTHYLKQAYQPIQLIAELNLNFFQGNIVKYLTRYKDKNGLEDVNKAVHYAELGSELSPPNNAYLGNESVEKIHKYCLANNLPRSVPNILIYTLHQDWKNVAYYITLFLIKEL